MDRATEASNNRTWFRGAAYRRLSTPRWPFVFRGLLPLLGLLGIALFGVTRFAGHWIEQQGRENIRAALDASGHEWADLTVSGQQVRLSGSPPSSSDGESALEVARATTCPTWLGPRVCAISVSAAFGDIEAATWLDLRGTVDSGVLTMTGEVPDEATRTGVLEIARGGIEQGRVTEVIDRLTLAADRAPAGFGAIARRVAEVASLCASGEAGITGGTFHVRCRVPRAIEPDIRALIQPPFPGGSLGDVSLVVLEDVEACEQDLAALQEIRRIEFASGSATIVSAAAPLLDRIGQVARTCPGILRIEGHTDSTGDPDANQALSAARAGAVREALISRGVPAERLMAAGYGPRSPVASNDTPEGRASNRRIEFRVSSDAN